MEEARQDMMTTVTEMLEFRTNPESTSQSWTHTVGSNARFEMLIAHVGNKVIDYVVLPVDENGMPV